MTRPGVQAQHGTRRVAGGSTPPVDGLRRGLGGGMAALAVMRRRHARRLCLLGGLTLLAACSHDLGYDRIPVAERRLNLSGLTAVSTQYLNEHPGDFKKFNTILSDADDALNAHDFITRAGVMCWIDRTARQEGYDDQMPVYLFVRTVYLEGWGESWLNRVDASDREYLYDLLSAVMGGMHLCTTCSTRMD
jgi:hypothetical protein